MDRDGTPSIRLPIWLTASGIIALLLLVTVVGSVLVGRAYTASDGDCRGISAMGGMQGMGHNQARSPMPMPTECPDASPAPSHGASPSGHSGPGTPQGH